MGRSRACGAEHKGGTVKGETGAGASINMHRSGIHSCGSGSGTVLSSVRFVVAACDCVVSSLALTAGGGGTKGK